jgi:ferredoxin
MNMTDTLREAIRAKLPELDLVLAWGVDGPLRGAPLFIRSEADLENLADPFLCVTNPAVYLYGLRSKKVGVVVKGCDSRSVIQLLKEGLVQRESLYLFGLPCQGVVDQAKILRECPDAGRATVLEEDNGRVVVHTDAGECSLDRNTVLADRCQRCRYPNPLIYDELVGEPLATPEIAQPYADLDSFEALSLEERHDFWMETMRRCIRCYACRNACPMCVCRLHCVADSRESHWLTQETTMNQKWFFQVLHSLHLAGRCTECGECERACPMGLPILLMRRKINREIKDLFGFEAGLDLATVPPLQTFSIEEEKISEREL